MTDQHKPSLVRIDWTICNKRSVVVWSDKITNKKCVCLAIMSNWLENGHSVYTLLFCKAQELFTPSTSLLPLYTRTYHVVRIICTSQFDNCRSRSQLSITSKEFFAFLKKAASIPNTIHSPVRKLSIHQ